MSTEAKSNPFIPADWGESYDLAGATWKPEQGSAVGLVVLSGDSILRVDRVAESSTVIRDEVTWELHYGDCCGWPGCKPLLPSPAFINAQPNPPAAAIAYLERAGFYTQATWNCISITLQCFTIWLDYSDNGSVSINTDDEGCFDPAIARYAVECFEVLHAWAAAVNWTEQNEVNDEQA